MRFVLLASFSYFLAAQGAVKYHIDLSNTDHHEAFITVQFSDLPQEPIILRMSRSSPGRYALHEFAKNVYSVTIKDPNGNDLAFDQPDLHSWRVPVHPGSFTLHYTLYGDHADGTYSGINSNFCLFNAPSTFIWSQQTESREHRVQFDLPKGFEVATQLEKHEEGWRAPNLYYFLDSPIMLGPIQWHEWPAGDQSIRLALIHSGTQEAGQAYAAMCEAITSEAEKVFGAFPNFDHGTYTFLALYMPNADGDGMEHRNSTVCSSTSHLEDRYNRLISTIAHEFFHAWNVERIRPASLEPFHFQKVNPSEELWFGEGFTSYYDTLLMHRAGLTSIDQFSQDLEFTVNRIILSPSLAYGGPADMSRQAGFVDAARSVDPTNRHNTFVSYYTYGEFLGIILDLELRSRGLNLDDFMKLTWQKFGEKEIPYTNAELKGALGEYAGEFGHTFFEQSIYSSHIPELQPLFERAGLHLSQENLDEAWVGRVRWEMSPNPFERNSDQSNTYLTIQSGVQKNTPLYKAGLERGDQITKIGETKVSDAKSFDEALEKLKPGEIVDLSIIKNGEEKTVAITLQGNPRWSLRPFEHLNKALTPEQEIFRNQWLDAKYSKGHPISRFCPNCDRKRPFRFDYCPFDGGKVTLLPQKN